MSLLGSFKINKAINTLIDANVVDASELREAINRIKSTGRSAVPKLIEALEDVPESPHIDNLLLLLLDDKSLPDYVDGLTYDNKHIVMGVMRVLARGKKYDANRLLELFEDPDVPKAALVQVLIARKDSLKSKNLFAVLEKSDKNVYQMVFRVIDQAVNQEMIPDLIRYSTSNDPYTRMHVAKSLSQFSSIQVRDTLLRMLRDSHKNVRQNALAGLGRMHGIAVESREIVPLLKDADLSVQASAIDTLIKIHDPGLVKHLIEILQDDSEYIRRAAVEVLNEVGDISAIKDLLNAMRDKDWWVKVRAADALGSIGGPKVVDAVLGLINEEDEFLRRTAVEILNSIKDERAIEQLMQVLDDKDWWVRERAVDALANMGNTKAVPAIIQMIDSHPESIPIAIKALTRLQDPRAIETMIALLHHTDSAVKKLAIEALDSITDEAHIKQVQQALNDAMLDSNQEITGLASATAQTVMARIGGTAPAPNTAASPEAADSAESSEHEITQAVAANVQLIDANVLKPGDMLENRYRVIRQVGKGAFGVVLLVEDKMVHEEIILKFLNAHMASDESVIKRFVSELRLTRKITHENVIRIYDFITFGKSYAISMEYFESRSLSQEIRAGNTHDFRRNTRILIEICKGLAVAHQIAVVHRDIKPANILVNKNEVVKIVDFGLAAAASQGDARLTKSGILVGTPTYMAPEQVRGRKIDTRTDIYSLGIVMYEMFTGRPPFKEKDHMATLFKHVEGNAVPAKEKNPEISDELNDIIMKTIHVDSEQRYQTVDELREALEALYVEEYS